MSTTTVPNAFFQKYVVYNPNGTVDMKKSLRSFEEDFSTWIKAQGDLKPAIIAELTNFKRLGEGKLVAFTMRSLNLMPNKENTERITNALQELQRAGKIVYKTTESGKRRGRGAGWVIREEAARPS